MSLRIFVGQLSRPADLLGYTSHKHHPDQVQHRDTTESRKSGVHLSTLSSTEQPVTFRFRYCDLYKMDGYFRQVDKCINFSFGEF